MRCVAPLSSPCSLGWSCCWRCLSDRGPGGATSSRLHTKPKYFRPRSRLRGPRSDDTAATAGVARRALCVRSRRDRHGDRSAIHRSITPRAPPAWRCDASAYAVASVLRVPAGTTRLCVRHVSAPALPLLRPSTGTLDDETTVCEPGQPTPRGFEQGRTGAWARPRIVSH